SAPPCGKRGHAVGNVLATAKNSRGLFFSACRTPITTFIPSHFQGALASATDAGRVAVAGRERAAFPQETGGPSREGPGARSPGVIAAEANNGQASGGPRSKP